MICIPAYIRFIGLRAYDIRPYGVQYKLILRYKPGAKPFTQKIFNSWKINLNTRTLFGYFTAQAISPRERFHCLRGIRHTV